MSCDSEITGLPGSMCCAVGKQGIQGPTGCISNPGKTGCPCIEIHQAPVGVAENISKKPSKLDRKSLLDIKASNNRIEKRDPDIIKKRLRHKLRK